MENIPNPEESNPEESNLGPKPIPHKEPEAVNLTFRQQRKKKYKRIVKWMWGFYITGLAAVFILFFSLSFFLPSFEELENPKVRIASEIYSQDGQMLGKYYIQNRTPVQYDSISTHVINALVSTEDERFYSHSGIDPIALGRVLVRTVLLRQRNAGGGSTISQQLAKLLVGRPDTDGMNSLTKTWTLATTKFKEWLTAVKLERSYTKKEILTMYLNEFDFLYNAHGIRSASETYFNKQPIDLTINESALLVRMLKNPSLYNYRRDLDKATEGRNTVLFQMKKAGHISEEECKKLQAKPINTSKFTVLDHNEGLATYFRESMREHLKEVLQRKENLKPDGEPYDLYRDGLKIYTTIDSRMQELAQQAVIDHLAEHQQKMFKHWKDWNKVEPVVGTRVLNPWTYKTYKNTQSEIEMRLIALNKMVWATDRYKAAREKMTTVKQYKLRDMDIYRILRVEHANKKPIHDPAFPRKPITGDRILASWKESGYATDSQIKTYEKLLGSSDWKKIKEEYNQAMKMMQTPVEMEIFAYVKEKGKWKASVKDTTMSPLDSIRYHRMHLQTGSISVEPQTGYVRSWVGGIDHNYFKLDHVNMGAVYTHPKKRIPGKEYQKRGRQVGSSIKPFLYSLNIDLRGYSPCYEVVDEKVTIEKGYGNFGLIKDWTPSNANGEYSGKRMPLTQALRMSLNSISAKLMKDLNSTEPFRNFLHEMGIDTAKVPASPTICLGTPEITPLEMAGAYTIFASGGVYSEPIFILKIEDRNGNPVYSAESEQIVEQVLTEDGAYVMSEMLQAVQRGAPGFYKIKSTHGGKTGTTNFQSDGWYMGITPNLVVGTWVGCDDRFIRFRTLAYGQGGSMARPIFQNFLYSLENDPKVDWDVKARFPKPDDVDIEMDCLKYDQFDDKGDTLEDGDNYTNQSIYTLDDDDSLDPKKKKPDDSSSGGTR